MKIQSVNCNHCGGPLTIPENTNFLTCGYCGTSLKVERSGQAIFTSILEKVDRRTKKLARDVDSIKLHMELDQLERQWEAGKEDFMVKTDHGKELANSSNAVSIGLGGILGGIIICYMAADFFSDGISIFMGVIGIFLIGYGIYSFFDTADKARRYRQKKHLVDMQRQELERKILLTKKRKNNLPEG
ncbi:MAG: hypothetical protein AAF206_25080 [Bacteroidota bacterium]